MPNSRLARKKMKKPISAAEKETKRTVNTFAFASFLNDLGAYMIYPIWPIFLTTILGANMSVLGFVDGLGDALVSLSQAASGYISDRIKRRKVFIWFGYLCGSASRIGYAITTSWPQVIPFRILDRAGKMRDAPRDAIVADHSTDHNRGDHFGILRAFDKAGAVVGILICIWLFNTLGYQTLFILAAIPSIIGAGMIYLIIKEKKESKIRLHKGIQLKNLTKNYKLFLALNAIFALGAFSYSFLLIFANKIGFAVTTVPILFLIFNFFAAAFSLPFGKFSDKVGRKNVMYLAFILWALVCIIFILFNTPWAIALTFVLYGLHIAALEPVKNSFVSELAPKKFRASALGGFDLVIGLCALPSSVIAGFLWDQINPTAPFILSLGLTIIAIILLVFVKDGKKKQ
jgi:MFS family permease